MSRSRYLGIIASLLVIVLISCKPGNEVHGGKMDVSGACDFLWSQQESDGAWRSTQHRIMAGGHVLTPFILYHMSLMPDSLRAPYLTQFNRGIDYLRNQLNLHGRLGYADEDILEYPNYANAYVLLVLHQVGAPQDSTYIKQLQKYLADQQFVDHRGFTTEDAVYGGWGFGEHLASGSSGQVDLSHTRRAIQALTTTGYKLPSMPVRQFLGLLQKQPSHSHLQPLNKDSSSFDGGFYYSPVVLGANKAHRDSSDQFISYPTATCDGLLSLALVDGAPELKHASIEYLNDHTNFWDWELPGTQMWCQAMTYYYLMVRSEVYSRYGDQVYWDPQVLDWLGQQQATDGSFTNEYGAIGKEDEPLLTTTMALFTWLNCQLADKKSSL